jgi:hypothetical protein
MVLKFNDLLVSRQDRFSLGLEEGSGRRYVSIPVSNQMVDYEEYYEIDPAMFDRFLAEPSLAADFVDRCRRRLEDARLFYQPGRRRGSPL